MEIKELIQINYNNSFKFSVIGFFVALFTFSICHSMEAPRIVLQGLAITTVYCGFLFVLLLVIGFPTGLLSNFFFNKNADN